MRKSNIIGQIILLRQKNHCGGSAGWTLLELLRDGPVLLALVRFVNYILFILYKIEFILYKIEFILYEIIYNLQNAQALK